MGDYLVTYEGGNMSWSKRSAKEIQDAMVEWGNWFKELEAKGVLRNPGSALARAGRRSRATARAS